MTVAFERLTPEMARRLAVADAQVAVAAASGALGQARRHKKTDQIPDLEKRLAETRERLRIVKAAV